MSKSNVAKPKHLLEKKIAQSVIVDDKNAEKDTGMITDINIESDTKNEEEKSVIANDNIDAL